jgi:hypothetical protein
MKLLWLPLLLAIAAAGEETADRAQIAQVIATLNQAPELARLFTADFDGSKVPPEFLRGTATVTISHEPWGEATWGFAGSRPRITSGQVRFLTPEIALVDGAVERSGAKESVPILFVMKKEGDSWRIASLRLLAAASPTTY